MVTGRAFDRLVNFTDAVVAVAVTILVLSIVDIRGTSSEQTVWQVIGDHATEITAFLFTFVVVMLMWQVHNRVINRLRGYDSTIFWLNLVWLVAVVFLPWPSALYGEGFGAAAGEWAGGEGLGGAGLLYWGTLAVISLIANVISRHVRTHPHLLEPDAEFASGRRGFVFAALFAVIGIATAIAPLVGVWLPLLLIPTGIVLGRLERTQRQPAS